jgi:teichuronic acid biosynthesis glycosyltransferase TuaG
MVDECGNKICEDFIVPPTTDFERSLTKSVISCSTVLLARPIVEHYRFETAYYHEDLVLWLRILRDGHSAYGLSEVLAQYRIMEGTRASNKLNSAICRWKVYREYLGFSVIKSACLLWQYAVMGLKKYKRSST